MAGKTATPKQPGKKKSGKKKKRQKSPADLPVLTLEETADYLRVPAESVVRLVGQQGLPGRQIDGEWRFLKTAVDDWLGDRNGTQSLLSFAGQMADDPYWEEMLERHLQATAIRRGE